MFNLYRADRKGRKTQASDYAKGLLTKQLDSHDDPEPQKKYGWLRTIKSHIDHVSLLENFIYDTSSFLSFTSDLKVCLQFLATEDKLQYLPADRLSAEAFIFEFRIDKSSWIQLDNAIFFYSYYCNYDRIITDPNFSLSPLIAPVIKCNICSIAGKSLHHLFFIDAEAYLRPHKLTHPVAYSNAESSKEWLVMPADPMIGNPVNIGFQSRIPVADFWDVSFFKYNK